MVWNDDTIGKLLVDYGETMARIYCLTTAYSYTMPNNKDYEKAKWYMAQANEFHNCDYVFGVMDLKHDIKEKLKECE